MHIAVVILGAFASGAAESRGDNPLAIGAAPKSPSRISREGEGLFADLTFGDEYFPVGVAFWDTGDYVRTALLPSFLVVLQ